MTLPSFAIRRPVTTIMGAVAIALIGGIAWTRLPQELFPPITYPQVSVVTQYKDAAPEEIETLVTHPIEEVVGTVPGLRRVTSVSKEEVSLVIAEFTWGTNMDFAALGVREKLDLVKERLPRGAEDPVVVKFNPFDRPILVLNLSGPLPPYELLELGRRRIKDALEKVEGVASVNLTGGLEREIVVEVDQGRLQASGTAIVGISEALAKANLNYPAGTIKEAFYEYLIRTVGEFQVVPELRDVPVNVEEDEMARRDRAARQQALQRQREQPLLPERGVHPSPRLVLLRDLAVVKDTYKERTSISRFNGAENVSLAVQKQSGANTVQVVARIQRVCGQLRSTLPPGVTIHVADDQSRLIRQAIRGVADAGLQGAVLAFLVLLLFLRNPWASLNVTAAVPLSILLTLGCMYFSGISLNLISLGGLALGVGMLVDAGIVVIENIDRQRGLGCPQPAASVGGTEEVGGAIVGTVLTTVVPFLPLIFVYGLVGQLFRDLAFTVTFSNLASLAVSMTLTPLLASWSRRPAAPPPGWIDGFARRQLRLVRWFLDHRGFGIAVVLGVFLVSIAALPLLPREFLPKVDQGQFTVKVEMPPGTRLETTEGVVRRLEEMLTAHPAVRDITVNIGSTKGQAGAELVTTLGPHQAQVLVGLAPRGERGASTAAVIQQLRGAFDRAAWGPARLEFLVEDSAFKAAVLASAPVVLEVRGPGLEELTALARAVEQELTTIPGLYSVRTSLVPPSPETKVRVLKDRAAAYHLSVSEIALTAQTAVKGFVATKFKEGGREIDVRVRLRPEDRADLSRVRRLLVRSPLPASVPLAEVAYLAVGWGPTEIQRMDRQRTVLVSANLSGRRLSEVIPAITARLLRLTIRPGYEVKVAGEHQEMQQSFSSLLMAALLAFLLVYMVMAATFESLWQPFVIMVTIPMALIGVVAALWVTRTPLSAMVGLGIMLLGGIVVDNGIVLMDFVNQLQRRGVPLREALLEASQTRLRPIVMTAATTILGVLPLAVGMAEGAELQGPMGITLIGGLLSATFLTLVFLPTVFLASEELLAWLLPRRVRAVPELAPVPVAASAVAAPAPPPAIVPFVEVPEIPEDYGREDAVPAEPPIPLAPWLPSAEIPAPPLEPPPPTPHAPPPPALNARQQWLVAHLRPAGRISRKQYADQTGVSVPTAARDLKELVDAGVIRGVGPLGPGRVYELVT